jgi:hypothetical protein
VTVATPSASVTAATGLASWTLAFGLSLSTMLSSDVSTVDPPLESVRLTV